MCVNSLNKMFAKQKNIPENYLYRLKYELEVIDKMGFNDYFLVVQDYVNYAKNLKNIELLKKKMIIIKMKMRIQKKMIH